MSNNDYDYEEFIVRKEPWNLYRIENGSIVKFKVVLIKAIKTGGTDAQGIPLFNINTQPVMGVQSPKKLRGQPSSVMPKKVEKDDISFTTIQEDWNEYELAGEFLLKIKPAIVSIAKMEGLDNTGEPLFRVQSQPLIKISRLHSSNLGRA